MNVEIYITVTKYFGYFKLFEIAGDGLKYKTKMVIK